MLKMLPNIFRNGYQKTIVMHKNRDFGNLIDKGTQNILYASNTEEIISAFIRANDLKKTINVGGATHSVNGQTLNDGGFRLLLKPSHTGPIIDNDLVEVDTAMMWEELEMQLQAKGRSCAVLTENWATTIGGTLSVGGIGSRSVRNGRQIDTVRRLRLIKPSGDKIWCSPTEHPEIFRFTLGGLGQLGVMDRVVLNTIEYKPFTVAYVFQYENLKHAADSLFKVLGSKPQGLDHFLQIGLQFGSEFICGQYGFEFRTEQEAKLFIKSLPTALKFLKSYLIKKEITSTSKYIMSNFHLIKLLYANFSEDVRLWNDWMFTDKENYLEFVRFIQDDLLIKYGKTHLSAVLGFALKQPVNGINFPFSYKPSSLEEHAFTIGIFYCIPPTLKDRIHTIKKCFEEAQKKAFSLSGRPYLYGWNPLNKETMQSVYGDDYHNLIQLKKQYDPDWILNSDIFSKHHKSKNTFIY